MTNALPDVPRRFSGASVLAITGTAQYTSARILSAEQRLLAAADQSDGRILDAAAVAFGLAETVNEAALGSGQAAMAQSVATDGRRLQLVITPAGAVNTIAVRVLACTWTAGGGHLVGLDSPREPLLPHSLARQPASRPTLGPA